MSSKKPASTEFNDKNKLTSHSNIIMDQISWADVRPPKWNEKILLLWRN